MDVEKRSFYIENLNLDSIGGSSLTRELFSIYPESFIISPGLLTGTPAPTGGRYSIGTETRHGVHISSIGGFIGAYIKGYRIDAVSIVGKSREKFILAFRKTQVLFEKADGFIGEKVSDVSKKLERRGRKSIVVGPAGEKRVGISSVISENFRSFGKGAGEKLYEMGIKALVFYPEQLKCENKSFLKFASGIREKLKAEIFRTEKVGHPCYGCPISCVAMVGKLKKGISGILKGVDNPERIVRIANDFGVDLFGAHLASKKFDLPIEKVIELAGNGMDFDVNYPIRRLDPWSDYLDSLGICKDAAKLLERSDIEKLHELYERGFVRNRLK